MAADTPPRGASAPPAYPEPLIVEPLQDHRQTFIILHGRGSFAVKFAPPLLEMVASSGDSLQSAFPNAKLIFPTASLTRATIYKRSYTHQWFNNWHLEDHTKRQDMMVDGLRASCIYIHSLLRKEIEVVGIKNVALWGLSQGCATSLTSLLTWDGEPFAATVGMCGWLPFSNVIKDIAADEGPEDDDPFAHSGDEDEDLFSGSKNSEAGSRNLGVAYLREELEMKTEKPGEAFSNVPVFLAHGTEDERVSIDLGREAKACLDLVGAEVLMSEYEGLGHWYSEDMLRDIFQFLKEKLGPGEAEVEA
ncbi:related to phospholipase/esterase [Phialocephala subalpina]|uniref:Related to phospholipase/esterase n=1 Tax=Phialocephala subalpina TaxID=576137 RepID=A0A1L7XII0_9HELO|nr:related to phospholipase/esterase [Phialocephala subalpina]